MGNRIVPKLLPNPATRRLASDLALFVTRRKYVFDHIVNGVSVIPLNNPEMDSDSSSEANRTLSGAALITVSPCAIQTVLGRLVSRTLPGPF